MDKICEQNKCTGCFACMNTCSCDAISMTTGDRGHIYPLIDENKCVDCGSCAAVCPANKAVETSYPLKTFAALAKDKAEYKTSASGGAATVITNYIIGCGGVAYGASFDGKVKHIRVDSPLMIPALKGSRYVHSHLDFTLKDIKNDLKSGKTVLFIGMPCQVAAVKKFIGENDRLFLVDMVCHGVPSQKLFLEHLDQAYGIKPEEIQNINFRPNGDTKLKIDLKDGQSLIKGEYSDLYYMAFYENMLFRDSCYSCDYANANRVGDITIGDFHGIGKTAPFPISHQFGISLLTVNTPKGNKFLDCFKADLDLYERETREAIDGNPQLRRPTVARGCEKFTELYKKAPARKALKRCLTVRRIKSVILSVMNKIRK